MSPSQRTLRSLCVVLAAFLCLGVSLPASAQFKNPLKTAGDLLKKAKEAKEAAEKEKAEKEKKDSQATGEDKATPEAPAAAGAKVLFSKFPIDPVKPENLVTEFKSGDLIYAVIQTEKTWRELLGKGRADATSIEVPIDMIVDGKTVDFQYITIKDPATIDSKRLVLDIAPDPAAMTAYKNEGFVYGEGKGNRKIGPDQYTYNLAGLTAGKHTVKFQVRSYGNIFSSGEMTLEGDDYTPYAQLREKILEEMLDVGGMPKAGKTDLQLQAQMMKLLRNAGWKNIRKLVIVDKDWWINYVDGSDSAVKSRHIGAAAASKAEDGSYFWCHVTFEQPKLVDGSFGALELSRTGAKKAIKEENIDK